MWTTIGAGLIKTIPAIVGLVERLATSGVSTAVDDDVDPVVPVKGRQKLDLAVNISAMVLTALGSAGGLTERQRSALVGMINASVEVQNAFAEKRS